MKKIGFSGYPFGARLIYMESHSFVILTKDFILRGWLLMPEEAAQAKVSCHLMGDSGIFCSIVNSLFSLYRG